jgi:hypothetical protein
MYDWANQTKVLKAIIKSHPGGVLDKKTNTITWRSSSASATSVQYGGCQHLGFSVTKNISKSKHYSEPEIFSLAISLANEYWRPADAVALTTSISDRTFTNSAVGNSTFFLIPREDYDEFYIEQNFEDGYVTIFWSFSF